MKKQGRPSVYGPYISEIDNELLYSKKDLAKLIYPKLVEEEPTKTRSQIADALNKWSYKLGTPDGHSPHGRQLFEAWYGWRWKSLLPEYCWRSASARESDKRVISEKSRDEVLRSMREPGQIKENCPGEEEEQMCEPPLSSFTKWAYSLILAASVTIFFLGESNKSPSILAPDTIRSLDDVWINSSRMGFEGETAAVYLIGMRTGAISGSPSIWPTPPLKSDHPLLPPPVPSRF